MQPDTLEQIAERLEAQGHDAGELRDLQLEKDLIERPPSMWKRVSLSVRSFAARQWRHVVGEFQESGEAMRIVRKAMADRDAISDGERMFVQAQLLDCLRVLPAGAVIFVNATLPIPATSILTPRILKKLGLVPSQWREMHLLSHLQSEVDRLRKAGLEREADAVEAVRAEVQEETRCRHDTANEAMRMTHWDLNRDGNWDEDEQDAYRLALDRVVNQLATGLDIRHWYLLEDDEVAGPLRSSALPSPGEARMVWICHSDDKLWVSLDDVLRRMSG